VPYINPIEDGMKVCRRGHRYQIGCRICPECRTALTRSYDRRRYQNARLLIEQTKTGKACLRCGFSDPRALVWHHRNRADKAFEISKWLRQSRSLGKQRLLDEIAKCDLICANCHLIEHA